MMLNSLNPWIHLKKMEMGIWMMKMKASFTLSKATICTEGTVGAIVAKWHGKFKIYRKIKKKTVYLGVWYTQMSG